MKAIRYFFVFALPMLGTGFPGAPMATDNHPPIETTYQLKDGSKLYVFKGGKMGMEDRKGRAVSMRSGVVMETADGEKIMMYGNEVWAVKAHNRPAIESDPDAKQERYHGHR